MTQHRIPLAALEHGIPFADRHIGPRPAELARMLDVIGVGSLEEMARRAVPASIREQDSGGASAEGTSAAPDLPPPVTEAQAWPSCASWPHATGR